jgi:hypothetical protein
MRRVLPLLPVTLVLAACSTDPSTSLAPSSSPSLAAATTVSNAQSIKVDAVVTGQFVIVGSEVWAYNNATAGTWFSNAVASGPTINCTGGGQGGVNCLPANQPPTPAALAADAQKLVPIVNSNSCNFWFGTAVGIQAPLDTYQQSVTLNGLNTKGNWTYTWTYNIAIVGQNPPVARSAWDLQSSELNYPSPTVSGSIYGLSTQSRSGGNGNWSLKASFSMADPSVVGGTRVSNLVAKLTAPDASFTTTPLATTLGTPVDVTYTPNAGTFGTASQLFQDAPASQIVKGFALSNGGALDDFKGNDSDLAEPANITSTGLGQLTQTGAYTLSLTGSVKSNSVTNFSQSFSTSQTIQVSAGSCQVPTP